MQNNSSNSTPSYNCPICSQPFLLTPYTRIYCGSPSNHLIIHTSTYIHTLIISFPTHEILLQDNVFYYITNSNPTNAIPIHPTIAELEHLTNPNSFPDLISYINQIPKYIPFQWLTYPASFVTNPSPPNPNQIPSKNTHAPPTSKSSPTIIKSSPSSPISKTFISYIITPPTPLT